ncbi:hypothetical protein GX51_08092 [Blastomyces parvus]|uniref:Uncharacterized protein n=1 Tax=Blastomyces parvus TaxID=2060905 RepID=A0A2B7W8K5_9EURO|nr:hypothetical protein GX51_08092 [Blastomyces parvus]
MPKPMGEWWVMIWPNWRTISDFSLLRSLHWSNGLPTDKSREVLRGRRPGLFRYDPHVVEMLVD